MLSKGYGNGAGRCRYFLPNIVRMKLGWGGPALFLIIEVKMSGKGQILGIEVLFLPGGGRRCERLTK